MKPLKPLITEIKAYSPKELAFYYDVCPKTLEKWLTPFQKAIGQRRGRYYTVKQVKIIIRKLGMPELITD